MKIVKRLGIILYPYLLLAVGYILPEKYAAYGMGIVSLLAFISSILILIFYNKSDITSIEGAKLNLIIKISHIPAYVLIFICGFAVGFIPLLGIILIFVLFLVDVTFIVCSGIHSVSVVLITRKNGEIGDLKAVAFGVLSFVFVVDVIVGILMYLNASKNNKLVLENN